MTALVTAFALAPLLFEAKRPGPEVLHPVAVVIFSGLISSTLLDTFLTPAMFWLFGRQPAERLMDHKDAEALCAFPYLHPLRRLRKDIHEDTRTACLPALTAATPRRPTCPRPPPLAPRRWLS